MHCRRARGRRFRRSGIGFGVLVGARVLELPDAQARQSVFALTGDEEVGEEINVFEHDGLAVGNALDPVFARGGIHGRGDEPEVAASIVGADEPLAVAMIDGIFVLVFAGADNSEFAGGLLGGEYEALSRSVAGGFEDDVLSVAGASSANVEALIVVLIDENVVGVRHTELMAEELELALLLLVLDGIEDCFIVSGPGDRANALDFSGQCFAGFEVFDAKRVLAEAGGVHGVGQPAAIVGDVGGADCEEGKAFGELIAVEDDLLGSIREWSAVVSHP